LGKLTPWGHKWTSPGVYSFIKAKNIARKTRKSTSREPQAAMHFKLTGLKFKLLSSLGSHVTLKLI